VTGGLLLDLDDTLIDTRTAMVAAGEAAVAGLWPQAGAQVHRAAGLRFHADPLGFFGRFTTGELSFAQMRQGRVADLLTFFSLTPVPEVTSRFEEAYEPAFAGNLRLFDDVLPLLETAVTAGITMGLLTNSSSHYTAQKLELTGLAGAFTVVATRDTLGFGKPDARAFRHACQLLGPVPSETFYVGDHLEIDAVAAMEAGLHAVWLQRDPSQRQGAARARERGVAVVTSLRQVPALWSRSLTSGTG
jgi:putative hydrolase of the HAD superfamily